MESIAVMGIPFAQFVQSRIFMVLRGGTHPLIFLPENEFKECKYPVPQIPPQ